MDVKKLIQAAEYCAIEAHETCKDCPMYDDCPADDRDPVDIAMRLLAIRDHVRAEVIAHVMEWASKTSVEDMTAECCGRLLATLDELAGRNAMAKIWCEECYGTGETPGQNPLAVIKRLCKACKGAGYTEAEVVEVEKIVEWVDAEREKIFENNQIDEYFAGRMNGMEIVKRKIMGLEE